jgi:deazaflavin-dependent oxidoreductase (nitroreductase family)
MDATVQHALENDNLIDITTTGRQSGRQSTKEIVFHNFDGVIYITGLPGKRDWYANMLANPRFTFHLKQSTKADLPAVATPVTDEPTRRQVLAKVVAKWDRASELEAFVQHSPLVRVAFE